MAVMLQVSVSLQVLKRPSPKGPPVLCFQRVRDSVDAQCIHPRSPCVAGAVSVPDSASWKSLLCACLSVTHSLVQRRANQQHP